MAEHRPSTKLAVFIMFPNEYILPTMRRTKLFIFLIFWSLCSSHEAKSFNAFVFSFHTAAKCRNAGMFEDPLSPTWPSKASSTADSKAVRQPSHMGPPKAKGMPLWRPSRIEGGRLAQEHLLVRIPLLLGLHMAQLLPGPAFDLRQANVHCTLLRQDLRRQPGRRWTPQALDGMLGHVLGGAVGLVGEAEGDDMLNPSAGATTEGSELAQEVNQALLPKLHDQVRREADKSFMSHAQACWNPLRQERGPHKGLGSLFIHDLLPHHLGEGASPGEAAPPTPDPPMGSSRRHDPNLLAQRWHPPSPLLRLPALFSSP